MEVGRRSSSSSANEFSERRSGKKKMGDIPLAMILSFNDKDVHPNCPNISNPYHKCGRHCLSTIPSGKNYLDAIRSDGDRVREKKSERSGVNMNCPYASNPYHKCAEYCSEKLSEKRQDAGKDQPAMRLKGSDKGEMVPSAKDETGSQPQCKHASNPTHECAAESCFQSVGDRNVAVGEKPKRVSNRTSKSSVHLNRNASGHSKVTEYCFEDAPKKEHLNGDMKPKKENEIDLTAQRELNIECKNASNRRHLCDEYCFQSIPEKEQHGQGIRQKSSKEGEKVKNKIESTGGVSMETCSKLASSPYNRVTEYNFEDASVKEQPEGAIKPREEQGVNLDRKSASNPDHVHAEYSLQSVPERERRKQKKPQGVSFKIDEGGALPNHKPVSNPCHEFIEYCFDDNPEQEHPNGAMKPKEERMVVTAKQGVDLVCKYASNTLHECTEYCFQNLPIKDRRGKVLMKSMKNKEAIVPLERMNTQCKHKSNPYHVCADQYCFQNVPNGHHPEQPMMKSKEEEIVVASPHVVNSHCKFASNPYHECGEYCLKNVLERDPPKQTIKKVKEEDIVVLPSERGVNPECKFASNPYHVCAEYCFQNAPEREQHGQVMKLNSLKDIKKLVSNKKVISEHPQCDYASNPYHQCAEYCLNKTLPGSKIPDGAVKTNERKQEKSYALRRIDNPTFKNASNFAEYSPEEISPENEAAEGSTATATEKRRNSSKKNKRNHRPVVEKISLNSNYFETSKPSQNYIESCEGIILQDGTEKSSMNSTNNNLNSNNGVSMRKQDETKDLRSEKVAAIIKNPKEPTDVPPLHIDASDLFHEWTKCCSQTKKVAEDEIVKEAKKVGVGESGTGNGKGNGFLKDNDSAKMEKVQATGGFPRSLLISLLFLLGFLLALLQYWTQVIHSLVISSEKNEEPERMKHGSIWIQKLKRYLIHIIKDLNSYCFDPGVVEEINAVDSSNHT